MTTQQESELKFLESLRTQYESDGYQFYIHPPRSILPSAIGAYQPDAIAIKPGKESIAIEVKTGGKKSENALSIIKDIISNIENWDLKIYYRPSLISEESLRIAPTSSIDHAIREVNELRNSNHLQAAFLMAWATIEAIARALLPKQLGRPQSPARVVESLATDGLLTPTDADNLRSLIRLRNVLAHGQIDSEVQPDEIDQIIEISHKLSRLLEIKKDESIDGLH
jgi:uncharacterized protein YutE (UPF0331/DUF86 family)